MINNKTEVNSSEIICIPFHHLQLISYIGKPVTGKIYLRNENLFKVIFRILTPKTDRIKVLPQTGFIEQDNLTCITIILTPSHQITDIDYFKRNYQVLIQTLHNDINDKNIIYQTFEKDENLKNLFILWNSRLKLESKFPPPKLSVNFRVQALEDEKISSDDQYTDRASKISISKMSMSKLSIVSELKSEKAGSFFRKESKSKSIVEYFFNHKNEVEFDMLSEDAKLNMATKKNSKFQSTGNNKIIMDKVPNKSVKNIKQNKSVTNRKYTKNDGLNRLGTNHHPTKRIKNKNMMYVPIPFRKSKQYHCKQINNQQIDISDLRDTMAITSDSEMYTRNSFVENYNMVHLNDIVNSIKFMTLKRGYKVLMDSVKWNPYVANPVTMTRNYHYTPPGLNFLPNLIKCSHDECNIFDLDCEYDHINPTINGFVINAYTKTKDGCTISGSKTKMDTENSTIQQMSVQVLE